MAPKRALKSVHSCTQKSDSKGKLHSFFFFNVYDLNQWGSLSSSKKKLQVQKYEKLKTLPL